MEEILTIEEMNKEALLQALSWQVETGCADALIDNPKDSDAWRVTMAELAAQMNTASMPNPMPDQMPAPEQQTAQIGAQAPVKASASAMPQASPIENPNKETIDDMGAITTIDDLKQALADFDKCELKRTASNLVFCDGNAQAKIMIIGEAPGKDEDRMGVPFVGSAGQLLDQMLASVGLDRQSVYITNIMPWRPPGNRTPTEEEVEMMRPFVEKHVQLVAPDVILALGGTSAKMLLQTQDGIMKLRGKFFDYRLTGHADVTVPLLPCLHPGYLLRAPHHKNFVFKDLLLLRRKALELA